jgi:4'-phosphopantetheinyl transferase
MSSVDVWLVDIQHATGDASRGLAPVTLNEAGRAAAFAAPIAGMHHLVTRSALRNVLPLYVGEALGPEPYRIDSGGKPVLARRRSRCRVDFSISHAGRRALIAVAIGADVGVDLEEVQAVSRITEIRNLAFNARERCVAERLGMPDTVLLFGWTMKEAVGKAAGTGLPDDPRTLDTSGVLALATTMETTAASLLACGREWQVSRLGLGGDHVGSVCVSCDGSPLRVSQHEFPAGLARYGVPRAARDGGRLQEARF